MDIKLIELSQNQVALIDAEDFHKVNSIRWYASWSYANKTFYARANGFPQMHRFIMNAPTGLVVDHWNHNGLDNRKSNLRICTVSENLMNRRGAPEKYLHRHRKNGQWRRGVYWRPDRKKWVSRIEVNDKEIWLGSYDTEEAATNARKAAEQKYFKGSIGPLAHIQEEVQ